MRRRRKLIAKIEKRIAEYCNRPASVALAGLVFIEVTIAPDAEPGERELRIRTPRGVSNPLVFHVGQLPEFSRKPMLTSSYQVLGKEELALRKRPADEVEDRITLPCTVNGQIASGEVNRYRFAAAQGPAAGHHHPGAAIDPLYRRRRARLVPARAGAARRGRQGSGV